jgi:hypothetical protein
MKMAISRINGGPEVRGSTVDRVIERIAGAVSGGEDDEFGSLVIVFHVHGSLLSPEHEGIRTSTFSKKKRKFQLQIAVPRHVVQEDETEIQRFVLGLMEEAVLLGEGRFRRAKIPYRKEYYLSLIDRARRAFTH